MAGRIMFAELHMLSGERQETSDLAGIAVSPGRSLLGLPARFRRRRGQLFTVAEPSLPGAEVICRELLKTIEDEYFRDFSRSVTSGLREAMTAAYELLRAENSKAPPESQLRVGLCTAALQEGNVYVAQIAPANAFILHGGSLKRVLCAHSGIPEVGGNAADDFPDPSAVRPGPQVNFGYSPFEEGDTVVLATGPYWKLVPERYILEAARYIDPETVTTELYNCYIRQTRRPTTSLIVIRMSDLPLRQHDDREGGGDDLPPVSPRGLGPGTAPRDGHARPGGKAIPSRDRQERPVPSGTAIAVAPRRDPSAETPSERPPTRPPRGPQPPASGPRRPFWNRWWPRRPSESGPLPPAGPPLEPVGKPSVRLNERPPRMRSTRTDGAGWVVTLVMTLGLAAVFVALGLVAINSWRSWQLSDPEAFLQEAREMQAQAADTQDEVAARGLLVGAQQAVDRALRAKEDEAARALAASLQTKIDLIDRTARVSRATVLVDYTSLIEKKADVTRLVLDGANLYVLDEGLSQIYRYALTADGKAVQEPGKHPPLVKRGDKVDGVAVGSLLSLAWMPAGQLRNTAALVALESGRALLSHDSKGVLSRIEVGDSRRWGTIQAINGFAGGLYLVDTKQKSVYYYPPTKMGYESEPYAIISSPSRADLSKAVDLALDGNLYLLQADGLIARFTREGKQLDFGGQLPDGPMKGPRSIFATADTRSVYVVDARGERIIQFSPEGKLQRQLKAEGNNLSFQELRDVFVDEAGRRVYLLARKSLLTFDLPPMQ